MAFDPNKPFELVDTTVATGFNPAEPFQLVGDTIAPEAVPSFGIPTVVGGQEVVSGKFIDEPVSAVDTQTTTPIDSQSLRATQERNIALSEAIEKGQFAGDPTAVDPVTKQPFSIEGIGAEPQYIAADLVPALQAGLGAVGAGLATYGAYKAGKGLYNIAKGTPEDATKQIKNWTGLTDDEIKPLIDNVDAEDIPLALANASGSKTIGSIKKAVEAGGDDARRALGEDLSGRMKLLELKIGSENIDKVVKETKHMYDSMVNTVAKGNTNSYDASAMLDDLTAIDKLGARSDASERTIKTLSNQLKANPNKTLEDALNFRADINYELNRATGKHKTHWLKLKENVDSFIEANTNPAMKKFVDDAVSLYAKSKNNEELVEIINKSKTGDGIAVNWGKASSALNKAGLKSPETDTAMKITDTFAKKFGNDASLASTAITRGSGDRGGVLSTFSFFIDQIKDFGGAIIGDQTFRNHQVQKVLLRSIEKSKEADDVLVNAVKDPLTPDAIRSTLANHLWKTKNIKPRPSTARDDIIDQKLIDKARAFQVTKATSQISFKALEGRVKQSDSVINKLSTQIQKKINDGKDYGQLAERLYLAKEKKLELFEKLEVAKQRHALNADKLERLGVNVEEFATMNPPATPVDKLSVTNRPFNIE